MKEEHLDRSKHNACTKQLKVARTAITHIILAFYLLSGCTPQKPAMPMTGAKPMRIVSMNPCIDAILMQVADRAQITAISHYSHDPRATSIDINLARTFKAVSANAEEVIAANPDLVITTQPAPLQTIAALDRLGIPVMQIAIPQTVAQSQAQIASIAARIAQPDKAVALNQKIAVAVAQARKKAKATVTQNALIWQGGLVPGDGTLADNMLKIAGYRNASRRYGLQQWDILPLEPLVGDPPQILFTSSVSEERDRILSHPVMNLMAKKIRTIDFPPRLLHCGGPTIITALNTLSAGKLGIKNDG